MGERRAQACKAAIARGRPRCAPLAFAVAVAVAAGPGHAITVLETRGGPAEPDTPLRLTLDRLPAPAEGSLVLFVGALDVTALVRIEGRSLVLPRAAVPISSGEWPLTLWLAQARQWRELYRASLGPTASAAPAADAGAPQPAARALTPALELTVKAQTDEGARGTTTPSARPTYNDLAGRGGVALDTRVGAASVKGGANLAGASFRQEALQFGTRGAQARKVDLADYRFEAAAGPAALSVGHLTWGRHPLLLDGYASRGLIGSVKLGQRADVALAALNGTRIVGFENFFGLSDAEHRIHGATFGIEARPAQPGWLRMETSVADASLRALANFDRGEVPDAERSRGRGLRLTSRAFDGRLRLDLAWARATYRPAEDPQLGAAATLTPLAITTRWARSADVAFDLLRALPVRENWPLTLTPQVRYEEAQPLYKMLGASLVSDLRALRAGFSLQLGAVQASWFRGARRDNLDDIASLLTTRTESSDFALTLPLPQLFGAGGASVWPQIAAQTQIAHQYAANAPDFALSGLAPTHRPDQYNRTLALNLSWALGRHSAAYGINHARQDNRQPGRETADFLNVGQQASLALMLGESLHLNLGANRSRQYSAETATVTVNDGLTFGAQWRFLDHWTLAPNAGLTRGRDSRGAAAQRGHTTQTQLGRSFRLPSPAGQPTNGQWFVRHALVATRSRDAALGIETAGRQWSIQLGASLTLF